MSAAHRRRELQRRILEVLTTTRGHGRVTAADVARRKHGRDGRRVAGALRHMRRHGLVDTVDHRGVRERYDWDTDEVRIERTGPLLEYSATPAGVAWLVRMQHDEPRLTDPVPKSWPKRRAPRSRQG